MDATSIGLIVTSVISLIGALAAAYSTVRKNQFEALEKRVDDLEVDLAAERAAHKATREQLATELTDERAAHKATREELATEIAAHTITRKELAAAQGKRPRRNARVVPRA